MPMGTATLDFGAFPGTTDASVAVTGQSSIASSSMVEAWVAPAATAEHSADEHLVESLKVFAGNIVAGVGFTIYGVSDAQLQDSQGATPMISGHWNIGWVWV